MRRAPPTKTLLLGAGLLAWGSIAQPFLVGLFRSPASVRETPVGASLAAHAAYLAAFLWTALRQERMAPAARVAALLVQSLAGLVLVHFRQLWLEAGLLAIVAAQASLLLPRRVALGWAFALTAAVLPLYVGRADAPTAFFWTLGVLGFQLFASAIGFAARHEAEARQELARTHAELQAAQLMLAESARTAERLHIARELHDAVGHHLTALSIHLDVARRRSPEDDSLAQAHALSKSMLGEVRAVVHALREPRSIDLPAALSELARGVPQPRVHLEIDEGLRVEDDAVAHAVLRGAQEAITNSVRHAGAENLWLTLSQQDEDLVLSARDDGRGAERVAEGNGLLGLRERLSALGGRVAVESAPGRGLTLRMTVPARGGAL
jgi:signal transduction histidine kinase